MTAVILGIIAMLGGTLLALEHESADALAPCVTHSNTNEELTFLSQLQSWRDANISGSYQLTLSGPLNAAAAGYAQYLVTHPGSYGHYADGGTPGRAWADRAIQCGYPAGEAAGGEGLAVVQGSGQVAVGPADALTIMTAEQGGGVWVPSSVGPAVACVGVAKASAANGTEDAWVTLLFGTWDGTCPQAITGGGGGITATPATSTPTNTATPTSTPTRTPTPSPTPSANYNKTITITQGWNLVTLPAGSLTDILDTARRCFSAVYEPSGADWLRYVPDAPSYASNLSASAGGVFWILGTNANCGAVRI
ncbi:MAG: hypothetical protein ABI305_05910 [Tepidiformaceae bacterium]